MAQPSIKDVLVQCQAGMQCHTKLLKTLHAIYVSMGVEAFWAEFERLIRFPMVVYNREPAVERTIDFIAKFVTAASKPAAKEDQQEDAENNPLLLKLFDFLLQHHNAKERAVRFRACQLVTKLLSNLGEGATIDDALYERVFHCMLERLRDRAAVVRVHAVLALVRLQEPTDDDCPVIKAYIFLMTSDPNPEVRKAIVSHIAASRKTLAAILERTRDVKEAVRQAAFTVIADKVPMKALSIAQRVQLLQQGLNDRSESVRGVCGGRLLQSWLRGFEGNALDLLHSLDAENSKDVCSLVLRRLFSDASIADLISNFSLLDESCVVPRDKLTCESALYQRELCQHIHKAGSDYEEHLDMVLPPCLQFCAYLESVIGELDSCKDLDRQLELEFIVEQLLNLFTCMDLTDPACRKSVERLLHRLLLSEHVGYSLVTHLLPLLRPLHPSTHALVSYLAETVADIRQPLATVQTDVAAEERRKIDVQVARVRVQLNQTREELEDSVRRQEFQRAAELKESIKALETERNSLLSAAQPQSQEVRLEKNDAVTVVKCLTIICEMLESLPLQTLTPTLQMLMENQILPGMSSQEASVRNLAVKAIGMCCQLKRDIVQFHLPILMQASQVDVESVRVTAVKALFDCIHVYGLGVFEDGPDPDPQSEEGEGTPDNSADLMESSGVEGEVGESSAVEGEGEGKKEGESSWSKTASNLIAILTSMLDNESGELQSVAVEGLAKLLLSGRVVSAGLLSRLLLLWYNPLEEENAQLRHLLGTFFPIFAFTHSANQQLFEEAFLPTLRTILNAPTTSPLSRVNPSSVADFLVELTHVQRLVSSQTSKTTVTDNPCHDSLALKVCNEILSNPQSFQLRLWTRILNQLDLSPDNLTHLKDLSLLCQQMMQVVKEKACVKSLEKFQKCVCSLLERLSAEQSSVSATTAQQSQPDAEADTTQAADRGADSNTPSMPPPQGVPRTAKSARKRGSSVKGNQSQVFTTPCQQEALESSRRAELESVRANLDSLLLESPKTPTSRTPRSKRALHAIQDPGLL